MENEVIRGILVKPGKDAVIFDLVNNLETKQAIVGGYIEIVYPFDDPVALVCNEEGKLNGLALNRALRDSEGEIYDVIAGNFLILGIDDDNYDFRSLTDEETEKFLDKFRFPELFVMKNGKLAASTTTEVLYSFLTDQDIEVEDR